MSALGQVRSVGLNGLAIQPLVIEAQLGSGLVTTMIIGATDSSLREAKERIRAAFLSCGIAPANKRLTISLSPPDVPKTGAMLDLAIAVAILQARGLIAKRPAREIAFFGELGLDGTLRDTGGLLALTWAAARGGFRKAVVPAHNAAEAALVTGIEVIACSHLSELPSILEGQYEAVDPKTEADHDADSSVLTSPMDIADVRGQEAAREGLLVAAVGGHHLFLHGAPGCGKTMLAERLHTLLPDLSVNRAVEVAAIRSLARKEVSHYLNLRPPNEVVTTGVSQAGLIGGGSGYLCPGAVSLAHCGVLVMDEAAEIAGRLVDALRYPLETGRVNVRRAQASIELPAQFQLAMTANPCPCGGKQDVTCSCSASQIIRYQRRLSAPILDRIDISMRIRKPEIGAICADTPPTSQQLRERVAQARSRSAYRWKNQSFRLNVQAPGAFIRRYFPLEESLMKIIEEQAGKGNISWRAADKIVKLSWSIADLHGNDTPSFDDFSKAVQLRTQGTWGDINE